MHKDSLMFPKHIIDLLNQRYYLKGDLFKQFWGYEGQENWELLCKRVAKTISANNPARYDDYFNLMYNRIFLPNSPTLFGAGLPHLCLSACFVIPMEDSVEGWAKSFEIAMKVQTGGGGCGFPLHYLRPKGFDLKNKRAKAAGPIEFMKCWNQISNSFSQAVRNGANMGYLRCDHPDLEEFITCKETDGNLKNFNISIGITDEFIDCLRSGKEFPLKWNGEIIKKINTKEVWEKICKNAWKNGEPGILYHDRVQQPTLFGNNTSLYVNPCLHGDTKLMTNYGLVAIKKVVGKNLSVYDQDGNEFKTTKIFSSGFKETITIKMKNGYTITCTPDHRFKTTDNEWVEAQNLLGKSIKHNPPETWDGLVPSKYKNHDFAILGFIFGDGSYHKASKRVKYVYIGERDGDVKQYIIDKKLDSFFTQSLTNPLAYNISIGYCDDLFSEPLPTRKLPTFVKYLPQPKLCQFLRGLFSANGFVINDNKGNQRVCIKMTNNSLIKEIQELLLSLGINSVLLEEGGQVIQFDNGNYLTRNNTILKIKDAESIINFKNKIGFIQNYKNENVDDVIRKNKNKNPKRMKSKETQNIVTEIIPAGKAEVFDFTQPVTHSGSICGYITHNCSEFNGPMGGSCNLGSINMAHFVQDKTFDYQAYTNTVEIAYEFLDDLIDVNIYPTKEIDETTKKYRQIGLGNMGIADAFIKMGLRYGDEECCKFFDKVMKVFQKACDIKNKQLGELRGPYPGIIKGCNRNATNSTYAPTGSLSQIAQCSSGIEPIFSFKFDRFINGVKVDEIEHPTSSGNSYIDVTTNDLNYLEHMRIVSIAQKYITMSISKTVNLPESASVDDVTKCFMQSYDMGLKCITVYRDNSRENQTISTKKLPVVVKDQKFQRCLTLDGKTFKDKIGCGNLYITINWDEVGKIQELFVNPGKNGGCPANSEGLSRIISIALRNGVLPESIIEQLKGIKCHSCMYKKTKENIRSLSCPDSISRALSDILNIQTESKEQLTPAVNTCPLCSTELQQYGNCKKCLNCGWSKCG